MTVVDAITGTRAGSQRAFRQSFDQTPFRIASSFTAVGAFKATVVNANQHVFRISRSTTGTQSLFHLQIRSDGSLRIAEGAGSPTDSTAASTLSSDTWYLWAMRQTGGSPATNTVYLYAENGTLIDTLSISDSTDNNITTALDATLAYAGYYQGSTDTWQSDVFGGSMALMSIWTSDLGATECQAWASDPLGYCLENPPDYLQITDPNGRITESGGIVTDISETENGFDLTLGGDAAFDSLGGPDVPSVGPEITGFDPYPIEDGETVVITGTGFEPAGTDATVARGGASWTVVASSDTEVSATADAGTGLFGQAGEADLTLLTSEDFADTISTQMVPSGYYDTLTAAVRFCDITETPASPDTLRISSSPDLAIGSQVLYKNFIEDVGGLNTPRSIDDLIPRADGSVSCVDDVVLPATFESAVNVDDGEGFGAFETITLDPVAVDNPELIGTNTISVSYFLNESISIPLSQQLAGGTWPWTLEAGGPLPGDFALNAGTGEITGTATPVGVYGAFTVRATGDTTDVDFSVTITVTQVPNISGGGRQARFLARVGQLMSR